jgi:phosphoenolpyruvate phosphomutase
MLTSNQLEFIMEAHNGLSAKIVEEAGFKGIWGSGLSISAQLGVRDSNEASYTQVLEVRARKTGLRLDRFTTISLQFHH